MKPITRKDFENLHAAAPAMYAALLNAEKWLAVLIADEIHTRKVNPTHAVQTLADVIDAIKKAEGR